MPNLSSLTAGVNAASTLANLVLVTPQTPNSIQPQNKPNDDGSPSTAEQPPTLVFHNEDDQEIDLDCDITDHYIEDNTAIQDQMAIKPDMYTVQGYIGEVTDIIPGLFGGYTPSFIANKLFVLDAFVPGVSATAQHQLTQATESYAAIKGATNTAVSAWSSIKGKSSDEDAIGGPGGNAFKGSGVQNNQQTAFQQFYGYRRQRYLFTVQTPWALFKNMGIQNLKAIQNKETRVITGFKITFKALRFAQTTTTGINIGVVKQFQGRAGAQAAGLTNTGTSPGSDSISLDSAITAIG